MLAASFDGAAVASMATGDVDGEAGVIPWVIGHGDGRLAGRVGGAGLGTALEEQFGDVAPAEQCGVVEGCVAAAWPNDAGAMVQQ